MLEHIIGGGVVRGGDSVGIRLKGRGVHVLVLFGPLRPLACQASMICMINDKSISTHHSSCFPYS